MDVNLSSVSPFCQSFPESRKLHIVMFAALTDKLLPIMELSKPSIIRVLFHGLELQQL